MGHMSSQEEITKQQKDELEKVLKFTTSIPDKVSYHKTMPTKRLIQGELIETTTIENGSKHTNIRKQTKEEQLYDLRRVLEL